MRLRRIGGTSPPTREYVYRFTGRGFRNRREEDGVYATPILSDLLLESPSVSPDLRQPHLLQEDGGAIGQE